MTDLMLLLFQRFHIYTPSRPAEDALGLGAAFLCRENTEEGICEISTNNHLVSVITASRPLPLSLRAARNLPFQCFAVLLMSGNESLVAPRRP
jgi:hypothetical protein